MFSARSAMYSNVMLIPGSDKISAFNSSSVIAHLIRVGDVNGKNYGDAAPGPTGRKALEFPAIIRTVIPWRDGVSIAAVRTFPPPAWELSPRSIIRTPAFAAPETAEMTFAYLFNVGRKCRCHSDGSPAVVSSMIDRAHSPIFSHVTRPVSTQRGP